MKVLAYWNSTQSTYPVSASIFQRAWRASVVGQWQYSDRLPHAVCKQAKWIDCCYCDSYVEIERHCGHYFQLQLNSLEEEKAKVLNSRNWSRGCWSRWVHTWMDDDRVAMRTKLRFDEWWRNLLHFIRIVPPEFHVLCPANDQSSTLVKYEILCT